MLAWVQVSVTSNVLCSSGRVGVSISTEQTRAVPYMLRSASRENEIVGMTDKCDRHGLSSS